MAARKSLYASTGLVVLMALLANGAQSQTLPLLTQWGTFGTGNGQFYNPVAVAVDGQGNVFVVDQQNQRVEKFSSTGAYITQFGGFGPSPGQLSGPYGVAVDAQGYVYVSNPGHKSVEKYANDGLYLSTWNPGAQIYPIGIAIEATGNVLVVDAVGRRVRRFTSSGSVINSWPTQGDPNGNDNPFGVAVDSHGAVYVSSPHGFEKYASDGTYLGNPFPGAPAVAGIAMDHGDNVYFVAAPMFEILSPSGTSLARVGDDGRFQDAIGIAVGDDGRIYVADAGNQRIQVYGSLPTPTSRTTWGRLKRMYK